MKEFDCGFTTAEQLHSNVPHIIIIVVFVAINLLLHSSQIMHMINLSLVASK